MKKEKNKKRILAIHIAAFVIFTLFLMCFIYVNDYYHAEESAFECITEPSEGITVLRKSNSIEFVPDKIEAGFVFYPGGKVQFEAYAPLMHRLAENNILCILVHMPANLAVLDVNAADDVIKEHPEVNRWYLGGHSLGGAIASSYLYDNFDKYEGLVLLAAYSTKDLSGLPIEVLSVYGSNDHVLNMDNYNKDITNLPKDTSFYVIEGGNHGQFGDYGYQKGDGTATISCDEQTEETVSQILHLIYEE